MATRDGGDPVSLQLPANIASGYIVESAYMHKLFFLLEPDQILPGQDLAIIINSSPLQTFTGKEVVSKLQCVYQALSQPIQSLGTRLTKAIPIRCSGY